MGVLRGIVATGILVAVPAHAEPDHAEEAELYVGSFVADRDHQFFDPARWPGTSRPELDRLSPELGVRYALFPDRHVGVEAEASMIVAGTQAPGADAAKIYGLRIQAMLQAPGRLAPFVAAGAGLAHASSNTLGSDTDWPIHIGIGARYFATPWLALRADVRFLRGPSAHSPYTLNASYGEASFGVTWVPAPHVAVRAPVIDDPDHDGVIGPADRCPMEPAHTRDGCPPSDRDGDGIPDSADQCPLAPEYVNGYEDDDGCPDSVPDSDNDGIDDFHDRCKDEPEDRDGWQDDDGCPDPDNDGDGLTDDKDRCVDVPGPADNGGCPDTDRDGDGLADRLDSCPDQPGSLANHGCRVRSPVTIEPTRLRLASRIVFDDTRLEPDSRRLLDAVARVLASHPNEIGTLSVEVTTDDQKRSDARAAAVIGYLRRKGIAAERLQAIGRVDKAAKRAVNRRVELNIVAE